MPAESFAIAADLAGATLAAVLKKRLPGQSWTQVRRLIAGRRVRVGGDLCLDPARRLKEGDRVELLSSPVAAPDEDALVIRYLDEHIVVVEKPSGLSTVRHPAERSWTARRKRLHPTLEDLLPPLIAEREGRAGRQAKKHRTAPVRRRLRVVHRLDKDTSGLLVFARTVLAESSLGRQFQRHTVIRRYLTVVPGKVDAQRIATSLVRDRGDGRRGSTTVPGIGKQAITHIEVVERLPGYTLLSCRLETGRTHQIRIHLAELGHPVCGEKVYNRRLGEQAQTDHSGAPRLALHATELGFTHPATEQALHWTMPLPPDLNAWLRRVASSQ